VHLFRREGGSTHRAQPKYFTSDCDSCTGNLKRIWCNSRAPSHGGSIQEGLKHSGRHSSEALSVVVVAEVAPSDSEDAL
jgi:hypothetical protein